MTPTEQENELRALLGEMPGFVIDWLELSDELRNEWKKGGKASDFGGHRAFMQKYEKKLADFIAADRKRVALETVKVTGDTSDGYHTFNELYDYRRVYNAALFNEWASQGKYDVHKSWKHSDGEDCFGGGWFIVVAELPTGQVSNHYEGQYWDNFVIPSRNIANKYDGHTPKQALSRITELKAQQEEV
jgi:hypothetical protein